MTIFRDISCGNFEKNHTCHESFGVTTYRKYRKRFENREKVNYFKASVWFWKIISLD